MKFTTCPKCGEENIGSGSFCVKCGASLAFAPSTESKLSELKPNPTSHALQNSYSTSSYTGSYQRYAALRGIAGLCKVMGWVAAVVSGLAALAILFSAFRNDVFLGLGLLVIDVMVGGLLFVIFRVISEGILVLVDVENNTRQSSINTLQTNRLLEMLVSLQSTPIQKE